MTDLFIYLIGTCSVYWCTFYINHMPERTLIVRVYDRELDIIERQEFLMSAFILDTEIKIGEE